jgi:hypothetical protein
VDPSRFELLLREHLLKMMPAATLSGPVPLPGKGKQKVAALTGPCTIGVRPQKSAIYQFSIGRSQKFRPDEVTLVECFVEAGKDVEDALGRSFEPEVLRALPLRVVARAAGGLAHETLLRVLEQFSQWAAEQYEGRPITAAVGIDPSKTGEVDIGDLWKEPFAPVLTNGMDTLLVIDAKGRVADLLAAPSDSAPSFSPHRYRALSGWAHDERVAVSLNRNGEILVFRGHCLRFALRAGTWQHFTHEAALAAIHLPHKKAIKTAIYETMLDVSFARSGGCLAVVGNGNVGKLAGVVSPSDRLEPPSPHAPSIKGKLLAAAVGANFPKLDRRLRAELLAMDGATVIDHLGKIIAVGAIVQIQAGSSGGGRLAAARTLGKLGLGVKISQDGGVKGFDPQGQELFRFG